MLPLSVLVKTRLLAVAVSCAIAVSGFIGWHLRGASCNADLVKMYQASEAAVRNQRTENERLKEISREDSGRIADLSRGAELHLRKPARKPNVPADPASPGLPDSGRGEDVTGIVQQFLTTSCQVNRAYYGPKYQCPLD